MADAEEDQVRWTRVFDGLAGSGLYADQVSAVYDPGRDAIQVHLARAGPDEVIFPDIQGMESGSGTRQYPGLGEGQGFGFIPVQFPYETALFNEIFGNFSVRKDFGSHSPEMIRTRRIVFYSSAGLLR